MRVEYSRRPLGPPKFVIFALLAVAPLLLVAQSPTRPEPGIAPRTTLIVFSRYPLHDDQWDSLFAALRRGVADMSGRESPLPERFNLIRGTDVVPGMEVDDPIAVYLEGDCTLRPREPIITMGALGWVLRERGVIAPYIHVECNQVAQVLGPLALGMDRNRRNTVMGEAVTRVILHEWMHIATQSATHNKEGIAKSAFSLKDLLADDEAIRRDPRFPKTASPRM
ncbi:MAG TPA: hypothetical protein VK716_10675 [Terracidiphilus sp.]|jgi:hypothetical protein|nr:hypothetical protein [Terracidiphilus sp.]